MGRAATEVHSAIGASALQQAQKAKSGPPKYNGHPALRKQSRPDRIATDTRKMKPAHCPHMRKVVQRFRGCSWQLLMQQLRHPRHLCTAEQHIQQLRDPCLQHKSADIISKDVEHLLELYWVVAMDGGHAPRKLC